MSNRLVSTARALELHAAVVNGAVNSFERSDGCLDGAIGAAHTSALYRCAPDPEPDIVFLVAYVCRSVAKAQCTLDGNKRLAWAILVEILSINGLKLRVEQQEAAAYVLALDQDSIAPEVFADWVAAHLIDAG